MNTKLFKLFTAGTLAVLLSSCGDTVVDNDTNSPVRSKATINVRVIDASGGAEAPLTASVTLNTTKESKATNAAGSVSFDNIPVGSHKVLVEKTDYASALYDADIRLGQDANISIAADATVDAYLYPKNASLQGTVFEDIDGALVALAGATVQVELNSGTHIVSRIFSKVTDAEGNFAFDSLPAIGTQYSLIINDAAKKYRVKTGPTRELRAGLPAYTGAIKYDHSELNTLFELVSYPSSIKSTDSLTFTFNAAIDFTRFTIDVVSVSPNPSSGKLTRMTIPSALTTQLVIKLAGATVNDIPKWPNRFKVCFNELRATDGKRTPSDYCTRDIYTTDNNVKFGLENYTDRIDSAEAAVLTFSNDINTAEFEPSWITVNGNVNLANVAIDGKKVTLTPIGGKWRFDSFDVIIESDLKAVNGEKIGSITAPTVTVKQKAVSLKTGRTKVGAPALDSLGSLAPAEYLDYNSTSVNLKWEKVDNATHYDIYGKASTGRIKEFVFLGTFADANNAIKPDSILRKTLTLNRTTLGLNYDDDLLYGKEVFQENTISLIIQARNGISQTSLSNTDTLVIKDIKSPSYASNPIALNGGYVVGNISTGFDFVNLLSDPNASIATSMDTTCVRLSEPMNTAEALSGTFVNASGGTETDATLVTNKISIVPQWGNKQLLEGSIRKGNGPDASLPLTVGEKDYGNFVCLAISSKPGAQLTSGTSINVRYRIVTTTPAADGTFTPVKDKAGNPFKVTVGKGTTNELSESAIQFRFQSYVN